MTEEEIKERAVSVVKKLEEEKSIVLPHYLVLQVMGSAMAKMGIESPIVGINPIDMSLIREIDRFNPGVSSADLRKIQYAVIEYLIKNNYADNYFEYEDV